jgi:hypothetical protein
MKSRKLKTNIPRSPEERLEYTDHRDRWTPQMQVALDKLIKKTFSVKPNEKPKPPKSKVIPITSTSKKHV